jgi:hypothetical protein
MLKCETQDQRSHPPTQDHKQGGRQGTKQDRAHEQKPEVTPSKTGSDAIKNRKGRHQKQLSQIVVQRLFKNKKTTTTTKIIEP